MVLASLKVWIKPPLLEHWPHLDGSSRPLYLKRWPQHVTLESGKLVSPAKPEPFSMRAARLAGSSLRMGPCTFWFGRLTHSQMALNLKRTVSCANTSDSTTTVENEPSPKGFRRHPQIAEKLRHGATADSETGKSSQVQPCELEHAHLV